MIFIYKYQIAQLQKAKTIGGYKADIRGYKGSGPPSIFQNMGFCNGKICWSTHGLKVFPLRKFPGSTHKDNQFQEIRCIIDDIWCSLELHCRGDCNEHLKHRFL